RMRANPLAVLVLAVALVAATSVAIRPSDNSDKPGQSKLVHPGPDGRLVYTPDVRGNVVPDYSYAGYGGGGVALPDAPVKVTLRPEANPTDDTPRIQKAIDEIATLP